MQVSSRLATEYKTVLQFSEVEMIINKSRFISRCYPCADEDEALAILDTIRKQHWDASHNCYAYCIGERGDRARFSDDGEPSGTAGAPMMDAIKKMGVTNLLCIVTRYFGGVLLGAGGLVRAYSKGCAESIKKAGLVKMLPAQLLLFRLPYSTWARVQDCFNASGTIESTDYSANVTVSIWVCNDDINGFLHEVSKRTDGSITTQSLQHGFVPRTADYN